MDFYQNKRDLRNFVSRIYRGAFTNLGRRGIVRQKFPLFGLFLILCCLSLFGPQDLARSGDGSFFSKKNRKLAASSSQVVEAPGPYDFTPVAENPAPVTHTSTITGTVADDNDAAVAGATVKAVNPDNPQESFETTTDSQGKYILPVNFKSFAWETLQKFDLDITKDGFTTKQKLVDVIANRTAGAGRSILRILDSVISRIGPSGGIHVNSTGEIKVTIPPGALSVAKDIRTTLYNKSKQLPGPLPPTSFFTYASLLTADGKDVEFLQPVTIEIDNSLGFAPNTEIPIGYYNEETREWEDSGQMSTVSADGRWVEFQTTHFSIPDCNFPAPPVDQGPKGSNNGLVVNNTSTNIDTNNQISNCNASRIAMRTGNLYQEHFLPKLRAMNQDITLELAYNSTTVKPSVILATQTDLDSRFTTQPETQSVKFEIEGVEASATYQNTWGKNAERFMWDGKNGQGQIVSTGSYPYTITLSNDYIGTYYTADSFGGPPINDTGVETREPVPSTTVVHGRAIVNNQIDSFFGAGWGVSGLKRLHFDPDERVLLEGGDGSSRIYDIPHQDIIVGNNGDNSISVLIGNGDGTFNPQMIFSVGVGPNSVAIGDFNNDSLKDLVTAEAGETFSVLIGNGNGTFQTKQSYSIGRVASSVVIGDLNGDNVQDLVIANGILSILLGNGDGTFQSQTILHPGEEARDVSINDFNQDSFLDLAVPEYNQYYYRELDTYLGKGDGTFESFSSLQINGGAWDIAAGDLNRDGFTDLVTANSTWNSVCIILGNGDGSFQPQSCISAGSWPTSVVIGDFNKDDIQDLAVRNSSNISILLGNGDGTFGEATYYPANYDWPNSIAVGDFNEDNNQDLVTPEFNGTVSVYLGNGDGEFQPLANYSAKTWAKSVAVGYVNDNPEVGQYSSPQGDPSIFRKNSDNTFTLTEKDGVVYNFNSNGLLTSEVDRNGNTTSYTYNADGQLETISYPGNAVYTFTYDPATKKLQSVADSAGRATQFVINANGDLEKIIDPDGTFESFTYNDHLMATKTGKNNNTTDYIYDKYGRVQETLTPEFDVWNGTQIVRERVSTRYSPSDVKGLINDLPPGQGTPENPAPIVDPLTLTDEISGECGCDVVKAYTNPFGSLTESQDGLGRKTTYTRDQDNNATKITYPNGRVTDMTYDGENLLTIKETYNSATTVFTYEPIFNQVKTIIDPLLNVTTFEYDSKGNLIQTIDDNSTITEMTYTSKGLLETITQAKGIPGLENTTRFEYDPVTSNLKKTIDPLTRATNFTYDSAGNLKTLLDAENKLTAYTYDLRNNYLMNVEDHLHNLTKYTYDNKGNLKTVEDARDKITTFTYNELNLLSSITNPLLKTKQFTYDADKRLGRILDAKNQQAKFEYDAANQLLKKYLPEETVSYGYDSGGNLNSVQDSDSKLSLTYDQLNRLTKAQTLSGFLQPVTTQTYTYDLHNNRATMVDAQNKTFYYTFDNLNRLFKIADYKIIQSTTFAQYVYDLISRRSQLIYPNTTRNLYDYNLASELTNVTHRTSVNIFGSFGYAYNDVGYRETMTTPAGNHQFTYDDIYRLTGADHPDFTDEGYTYDAVGNRLTESLSPLALNGRRPGQARGRGLGEGVWLYNAANQLLDDGTYTYTYDNNGNMTQKILKANPNQKAIFTYNSENQLIQIDLPGGSVVKYAYDGLGRRIQKSTVNGLSSIVSRYVYDNEDIIAEYDGSNVLQATYLHGPGIDEPVYMERGGQKYYYHSDGLGSITELTNSSGAVVQTYKYDAFGNIVAQTGTLVNPFTYTGREFDSESGLYYYRARFYDPRIGRFLQEDPIWDVNLYPYAANNPVNNIDPLGLHWVCDTLHGCYFHTACIDGHEHPNRDAASQSCPINDESPEIPDWVCDVGVEAGCHMLCESSLASPVVCFPGCLAAATLTCAEECE